MWIQHGEKWGVGDQIITGADGGAKLQLGDNFFLQIKENSHITYLADNGTETSPQTDSAKISVGKGTVCIYSSLEAGTGSILEVDIGNTMRAILQYVVDVCLKRTSGVSSVLMWSGSIKIEHYPTEHTIVLSEAGTELRAEDGSKYQFLKFDVGGGANVESVEAVSTEEEISAEAVQPEDKDEPATGSSAKDEKPASAEVNLITLQNQPGFEYIVYLFSTRSEETAEKTSRKFQESGYKTHIYEHENDEVTNYRVALPGFETKQAAEDFSQSIIGKLGVRDTWIDKERRKQ